MTSIGQHKYILTCSTLLLDFKIMIGLLSDIILEKYFTTLRTLCILSLYSLSVLLVLQYVQVHYFNNRGIGIVIDVEGTSG